LKKCSTTLVINKIEYGDSMYSCMKMEKMRPVESVLRVVGERIRRTMKKVN
jgi:hypothetical protein